MINVTHYTKVRKLVKYENLRWIYIGGYKGSEYLSSILNVKNRVFVSKIIEAITDKIRNNFVDYVGIVSTFQDNKISWYASRVASKSISQNTIFQHYVYLKLLEDLIKKTTGDMLFISDDFELLSFTNKIFSTKINVTKIYYFNISWIFSKLKDYLKIIRYIPMLAISKMLKNKNIKKYNVFIHTWISEKTFSSLPDFYDANFGKLEAFLRQKKYLVARLIPVYLPFKYFFILNKKFKNIVFPLSYLKLKDFIKCINTKFTINFKVDERLKIIDDLYILHHLTENEIKKENKSPYFITYLLSYYSYKSLSGQIDKTASFIYPFENQPWEKMLNLALPNFNKIGYQHTTIPINWLDYRLSRFENNNKFLPETIMTAGKEWTNFLKSNYTNQNVKEIGTIRFSHLFNNQNMKDYSQKSKNILVVLPISTSISISLLKLMLRVLKTLENYTIKIKIHPYSTKVRGFIKNFNNFKNCIFVENNLNLRELLNDCELCITSGSAVVFESLLLRTKTLYLIPEEVSLGHEYFIRKHLFIAYEDNFAEKLNEALLNNDYPNININDYFSQPDFNTLLNSLNFKNNYIE